MQLHQAAEGGQLFPIILATICGFALIHSSLKYLYHICNRNYFDATYDDQAGFTDMEHYLACDFGPQVITSNMPQPRSEDTGMTPANGHSTNKLRQD
jgi:hypothetical protein